MAHSLVDQLRFTRAEWLRALDGTPDADGLVRLEPMNSIGWIVAHMAWHEQLNWLTRLQGTTPEPRVAELAATGGPPTTPALAEMLAAWRSITAATDPWLDDLDGEALLVDVPSAPSRRSIGTTIRRVTYHYWFHIGEVLAIRQILGHRDLPEFVGDIDGLAPFRPEAPV